MASAAAARHGGSVRFMVAIDNFEHLALAYGAGVANQAMDRLRASLGDWLGAGVTIHFETGGIIYGTWQLPADSAAAPRRGCAVPQGAANRIMVNPPVLTLRWDGADICLSVSGTWAIDDGEQPSAANPFAGGCRAPYFGAMPARDAAWAARYRADMAAAARVLAAISRETASSVPGALRAIGGGEAAIRVEAARDDAAAEQLVLAWRPVRDAAGAGEILFYEMCPLLVGSDGRRRDLAEVSPALERLGLAWAVDRFLVEQALDLLEADPDVALAVPVSAQSVSACSRWSDVFRRLTGDRSIARRLTLAIAETTSFPDFAEAIQFVSRLQTFGVAVAIDNFGLGYTSIRELLALAPDIVCIDPFFVRYGSAVASEGAALTHLAGLAALMAATVVVKGVATARHSHLSLDAGIRWQQGDYLGAPGMGRPWSARAGTGAACRLQDRTGRRPRAA